MIKSFTLLIIILIISSCASTSVVMLDEESSYSPTENVELLASPPTQPYKEMAILEARGPINTPLTDLLNSMKQKAAAIGADAVIYTQDASRHQSPGIMYNPVLGGYQTIGGGTVPIIRGIAIKYTGEGEI